MLAVCLFAASVTSCVSDGLTEPGNEVVGKEIATLEEQASSVMTTISDVKALKETVDGHEAELNGAIRSLENHVSYLSSGSSWEDATLATLAEQKKLAAVVGPILAQTDAASATKTTLNSLDANAKAWLGKNMGAYWSAVSISAKSEAQLASYCKKLSMWRLQIEGIASDIEAGLKEGIDLAETDALLASVSAVVKASEDLNARLAALASDVEEGYQQAIATASEDPESFDAVTLKSLNKAAAADLQDAGVTMNDLIDRVAACENEVTAMKARIDGLEDQMKDWAVLLDMIQSVTFMSEYSEEKVVAYYTLNTESDERTDEGYMLRTKDESIELKYIVRPASAAMALASDEARTSLWNQGLKVMGYYAQAITKAAPAMTDFTITDVTADESGIVTVTVENSLSDEFYFKKTGAKMALSVVTGKTDLASEFVEVVPVDKSGTVYVESIELSKKSLEIDNGEIDKIEAYVTPENVTASGVIWTTSNADILTVASDGTITAKDVGTAVVTATTKGTNEWGNAISAQCNVKVNPSIKIQGYDSVAEGGTTQLSIQSPNYIDPQYIHWEIGTYTSKDAAGVPVGFNDNQSFASIDENGLVSGVTMYYNKSDDVKDYVPIAVKCTIDGATPIVLYHDIRVIAVQPLGISINGLSDTDTQKTTKVGQPVNLSGTIKPESVNGEYFKLAYLNAIDGYFAANNVGTTTVTVSIENGGTGQYSYFYPKGKRISRNITVVVNPCYVTSISLPETHEMNLDQTGTLDYSFTSDVEGMEPTYQDLMWTSSNPTIVSINETTGEMTSLKEGTVTITATTSHENAVPSGQPQQSARCVVTVKKPTAPIAIGDYYYDDGTWSTEIDNSKNVIGIVFSKVGATTTDTQLSADHSNCYNGLVVSLEEATTAWQSSTSSVSSWASSNLSYSDLTNYDRTNGYSNTIALKAYNEQNSANKVLAVDGTAPSADAPGVSSGWYLPSYKELSLLAESYATIKDKLASVGTALDATTPNYTTPNYNITGDTLDTYRYWASTESSTSSSWGCCVQFSNCSMMSNQSKNKDYYRVRYILAF